jgi:hypothetical protein
VAEEREEEPAGDADAEEAAETSQETAVGHSVIEEPAAEPARDTAVGHSVVDAGAEQGAAAPAEAGTTEVFFTREEPAATPAAADETAAPQPAAAPPSPAPGGTSPAAADRHAAEAEDSFSRKPELFVAGAFVGAFVLGKLLKRLTGSDD